MKVLLEQYELEAAHMVGLRRHSANLSKKDASHYDPSRMENNIVASIASACAELAVAKATLRYWPFSAWDSSQHAKHRNEPDVFPNIEVRRVRLESNPLVVRARDVDREHVMVCAWPDPDTQFQSVEVHGWMRAREAWSLGSPSKYDPENTRLVDQEYLSDIAGLIADVPGVST